MKSIYVCMGSACYMKGAPEIVEFLNKKIKEKNLSLKLELKGSFCLGPCIEGVVVKFENKFFKNLNKNNIDLVFKSEIFPYILEKVN